MAQLEVTLRFKSTPRAKRLLEELKNFMPGEQAYKRIKNSYKVHIGWAGLGIVDGEPVIGLRYDFEDAEEFDIPLSVLQGSGLSISAIE